MKKARAIRNYNHVLNEMIQDELKKIAYQSRVFEVCGFVLDNGEVFEIKNISKNPRISFFMSPNEQFEFMKEHRNILGVWHTHPSGSPYPSEHDEQGVLCGLSSQWWYWIVTTEEVLQYSWDITEVTDGLSVIQS